MKTNDINKQTDKRYDAGLAEAGVPSAGASGAGLVEADVPSAGANASDSGARRKRAFGSAKRFVAAGVLMALSVGAMALFSQAGQAFFPAYRQFTQVTEGVLATVTGIVPIAVWDWILLACVVGFVVWLVATIVRRRGFVRWLSTLFVVVAALFAAVVFFWGLDHYAPSLASELDMQVGEYSAQELEDATQRYLDQAAELALSVPRDDDGHLTRQDFDELAKIAGASYTSLSAQFPVFAGSTKPVKALVVLGPALLYGGNCGIICPVTGEASVPLDCAIADEPFTMCHEVAHRCGIASEQEANFASFLACESNADVRFRYAGFYCAFCYCYNALVSNYPDRAKALITRNVTDADRLVYQDANDTVDHYDAYSGPLEDAGTVANDVYLKAFSEDSGVKSYGLVVDYLIAHLRQ